MIWLTSDWHFNHDKEFIWKARGFESIDAMNEYLVAAHNSLVAPNDDVYVLGDLILGGPNKLLEGLQYITRMNGRLHLVRGNHDTPARWNNYASLPNVVERENAIYLDYDKYHFYLSHFPTATINYNDDKKPWQRVLNISGHTHSWNSIESLGNYNVAVDAHICRPTDINSIIEEFNQYFKELRN